MANIDSFAKKLIEEAKRFLEKAKEVNDPEAGDAFLHSALLIGFSALEAHVNAIADDFIVAGKLTVLEESILSERDIKLEDDAFVLASGLKMYRLTDRIEFLYRRYSGSPINRTEQWWTNLKASTSLRNELTHPKAVSSLTKDSVAQALQAIIDTLDHLYKAVYNLPYPPASRLLTSSMTF